MEWNGHCTRWHVQPALFNLGWTMTLGLLSREDSHSRCTSSTPWSIFCPGLTRSMFFCSAVLAAQHVLLTIPCYMFLSFIVCGILQLCESLRDTMVPPEASLQEQDGSKSTTHVQNVAVGLPRNTCAFSNFLQLEYCYLMYLMYNVRLHTTYIQTPLAFNILM